MTDLNTADMLVRGSPVIVPPYVGRYNLGGLCLHLVKKPSAWHRFWMRVCLGWVWEEGK